LHIDTQLVVEGERPASPDGGGKPKYAKKIWNYNQLPIWFNPRHI